MRAFTKILALLVVTSLASPANADNPNINMNANTVSVFSYDLLGTYTNRISPVLDPVLGLWFTYRNNPLSLTGRAGDAVVVEHQAVTDLYFSIAPLEMLAVGIDVPIFLVSSGQNPSAVAASLSQASGASLGDLRLSAKVRFLGDGMDGFSLGLAEDVTFPTATGDKFTGEDSLTSRTGLVLDYAHGGLVAAINLSYLLRANASQFNPTMGDELQLRAALQVPVICDLVDVIGVSQTRTYAAAPFDGEESVGSELMAGVRVHLPFNLVATGAGGGSIGTMPGTPAWQMMLQIGYESPATYCDMDRDGVGDGSDVCPAVFGQKEFGGCPDRDRDGVLDAEDACPDLAGVVKLKGCPDKDKDFVADKDDACPNDPGLTQFQGCPDDDGDGIPNPKDSCPKVAGIEKFKGCPDTDKDGIEDAKDACPTEAGPADTQGCPDRDKDGIKDSADKCPDVWGTPQNNGCPPETPKDVQITKDKIVILDKVYFDTGKSTIQKRSFPLLKNVAIVLKDNPWIKKIRVEGHTDDVGSEQANMTLSQARAEAVRQFLIKEGVEPERLEAVGYGPTRPLDPAKTKEARAQNRRVEFSIIEPK